MAKGFENFDKFVKFPQIWVTLVTSFVNYKSK